MNRTTPIFNNSNATTPCTMRKIKFLRIGFAPEISAAELPLFRGAIARAVGPDNVLFHNHLGDEGYRYAYPLIQYKRQQNKPVLICLEAGAEQIHALFAQQQRQIRLGQREIELNVAAINLREITLQVWDRVFQYRLHRWLALNGRVYDDYRQLQSDTERKTLLASILRGNILSMAKGLGWFVESRIEVKVHEILRNQVLDYKDTKMTALDVSFSCNVHLPGGIGLGKGVARGFGVVSVMKNEQ
jgi:hypothetical protein